MKDSGWLRESCTYECVNFQKKQRCLLLVCTFWASTFAVKHTHTHTHTNTGARCQAVYFTLTVRFTLFFCNSGILFDLRSNPQKKQQKTEFWHVCMYVCMCVCVSLYMVSKQKRVRCMSTSVIDVLFYSWRLSLSPSLFRIINSAWAD